MVAADTDESIRPSMESRHDCFGEELRGNAGVPPKEFDDEVANAETDVALDPLHDLIRASPDAGVLDVAEVTAVEACGFLHFLATILFVLTDHDESLLRKGDGVEVSSQLAAMIAEHFDLVRQCTLVDGEIVPDVGVLGRNRQ